MEPSRIVGIGASAGGLAALEQLFSLLPADTGMAFVIIQHLSPEYPSLMDELLSRCTPMTVVMASDGQEVEANTVYLLPPAKLMVIQNGRLVLTDRVAHTFTLPIDTFMRSLARDAGDRAIAVILSGSGTDGSRGVVDIKQAGGVVLAESLDTAKFDGMPRATMASGTVDHVLPPREIARTLVALGALDRAPDGVAEPGASPTDAILDLLEQRYGIDFSLYKMTTVARRIQRRFAISRLPSLDEYLAQLRNHREELDTLYHDLLIGVTQFFRDPPAFESFEHNVLDKLFDMVPPEEEMRVWVAGCATGEEAYTITMLLLEGFEARNRPRLLKVLATDVHEGSLGVAAAGIYGASEISNVSAARLGRWFAPRPGGYQVSREVRQHVVFARHDVTRDAPFTRMHLITCRNMLIYLEPAAYRSVIAMFHFGLVPNGFLFLGASETTGNLGEELTTIDERWRIFQKRRDLPLPGDVKWPTPMRRRVMPLTDKTNEQPLLDAYDALLDMFMPPGFLVDEDRILVDSFAGSEKLLHERARRPTRDLAELLQDELKLVVIGAVRRAVESNSEVSYGNVRLDFDGPAHCTLVAKPLTGISGTRRYVVVTLRNIVHETVPVTRSDEKLPFSMNEAVEQRVAGLETDLAHTREMLQTSDVQLRQSHEDLQAANEELIAANEELHSMNEELQSVNEELYTVNAENQKQIADLRELNANITHFLEDTDIGTVFLDKELRIRRFTSRTGALFRFRTSDIGRQITDFSHTLERPQLYDDIRTVLDTARPMLAEVSDTEGRRYLLRIAPVRSGTADDGLILSLTDITALEAARRSVT